MKWLRALTGLHNRVEDHPFSRADLARLHDALAADRPGTIDGHTARDLLFDDYLARMGAGTSIFGRQMLHHRLYGGAATDTARVRALLDDPPLLVHLKSLLAPLRQADVEIAGHLFGPPLPAAPAWPRWLWVLPVALVASIALAFVWPAAWVAAVALAFGLIVLQALWQDRAAQWDRVLLPLRALLDAHGALGKESSPWLAAFGPDADAARRLRPAFALALADRVPGQREYRDWFMQANVRRYFATRTALAANVNLVRDSLLLVAALEADCALAAWLARQSAFCWAEAAGPRELVLDEAVHPLLADPVPLSLALHGKGAFLSGRNGVGKSTLLRTVGLHLATARAFGFCHARRARVPVIPVYASMQHDDTLAGGESLYMAEMRRARELTELAAQGPAVFVIDEIFRGTNHFDSVAAATAVLDVLARGHLVIVASHHLALAPLLRERLDAFCVDLDAAGRPVVRPGVLRDTNGIALLADYGFDPTIADHALRVHAWLGRQALGEDPGPVPAASDESGGVTIY
jgi:hypothetical protein